MLFKTMIKELDISDKYADAIQPGWAESCKFMPAQLNLLGKMNIPAAAVLQNLTNGLLRHWLGWLIA